MRAKLERIAAGKIEFDRPVGSLSDSVMTLSCRPGEKAEGSFTLTDVYKRQVMAKGQFVVKDGEQQVFGTFEKK